MWLRKGITVELDEPGVGTAVQRGDTVTVRYSLTLNRGEVVQSDQSVTFVVGTRVMIAGLEYGLAGMRVGGRRQFRVSPHLAYRDVGVPGKIPPDAVLIFDVRLLSVENRSAQRT